MASFSAGTTFTDGVANDVTAAKLAALVNAATPTSGLIQDRTAETAIAADDTLLFGDFSDSNNLKRMTVANFNNVVTTGTGTAASPAIVPTGDSNTGIFFPAADTIAFSEGGTEAMRIDSNGKVLINSTTEKSSTLGLSKLQVYESSLGLASNTDYTPQINLVSASDTSGAASYVLLLRQKGTIESPTTVGSGNQLGNLLFGGYDGTTNKTFSGITSSVDGTVTTGTVPSNLIFSAGSSTLSERMRITSAGNVGIGTASPSAKLDIYDATSSVLNVNGDATVNAVLNRASADTAAPALQLRKSRGSVASPAAVAAGDALGNINFQAFGGANNRNLSRISGTVETYVSDTDISSNLTFLTSPAGGITATERMRIDSSGNVSIGTATALSRLHVHGDLTLSNATTGTTASTSTITPPATVAGYLTVSINGTSRKIPYYAT